MVVLLLVGTCIGVGLAAIIAHNLQIASGKEDLRQYTGRVLRDMEAIPKELRPAYTTVLTDRLPFCSDQELELMRIAVFLQAG